MLMYSIIIKKIEVISFTSRSFSLRRKIHFVQNINVLKSLLKIKQGLIISAKSKKFKMNSNKKFFFKKFF